MPETITTRPFKLDDLDEVLELLRVSLGETPLLQRSKELFSWKHLENPFGESLALVAESSGRIIALRAMMRWDLSTPGGTVVRCLRPVDTATHPEFQRRGLFRRLTNEAIEQARSDGIHLIFNTPNARSRPGYLSMGWVDVGDIRVLARPSRRALAKADPEQSRPTDLLPGVGTTAEWDLVDRPARGLRTVRSRRYAAWRFGGHPTARYFEIPGDGATAIVRPNMRRGRTELVIADVHGANLRSAFVAAFRASRAAYAVTSFAPGSPERRAARRSGMVPLVGVSALRLVCRPLIEHDMDPAAIMNWDFALSDLELL